MENVEQKNILYFNELRENEESFDKQIGYINGTPVYIKIPSSLKDIENKDRLIEFYEKEIIDCIKSVNESTKDLGEYGVKKIKELEENTLKEIRKNDWNYYILGILFASSLINLLNKGK